MPTRSMILALCVVLAGASGPFRAQESPEQAAQRVAEAWMQLIDDGKYVQSWEEAAELFKAAVSVDRWPEMIRVAREPLGAVRSRVLRSASRTDMLPGAPDGAYVVLEYESSFEHKASAIETITPMLDESGTWRISGYYLK